MERIVVAPRKNYQQKVEDLGLVYHTDNGKIYWDERVCYRFTTQEIRELEAATNEIEKCCVELIESVIHDRRYDELNLPEYTWDLIETSWKRGDKPLFGRLDLSYDGRSPPKLLEYSSESAAALMEASIIQSHWRDEVLPGAKQFNSIHHSLVEACKNFGGDVHLTCVEGWYEDLAITRYVANIFRQAGLNVNQLSIEKIDWNGQDYVDTENEAIKLLFKFYPWEWLIEEWSCENIQQSSIQFIEPPWTMLLCFKGLLVKLWEMFPNHPNLLPAYFDRKFIVGDCVQKPIFGMRGESISLFSTQGNFKSHGRFDDGPFMYQQLHPLSKIDGNYAMIGSWLIAGKSAGIGVREDIIPIMNDDSRFVPHYYTPL